MGEHGECLGGTLMKCPGISQGEPQGMPRWTYIIIINIKCFSHEASAIYDNFMELFINSYHNP